MGNGIDGFNLSEKYRFIWVAPSRTGSRGVAQILSHYGFKHNEESIYQGNQENYCHFTPDLSSVQNYKLICSARNPYGRLFSHYKNYNKEQVTFEQYVKNKLWFGFRLEEPILSKKPDYLLRLEHLKEDFTKIPFIFDRLTEKQLDTYLQHGKELDVWEQYYDQHMKEIVYRSFENHFIFWNYKK
jgi:hypothetical protein